MSTTNRERFYIFDALKDLGYTGFSVNNDLEIWYPDDATPPTQEVLDAKINEIKSKEPLEVLRRKRNDKLAECDWTQNRDVSLANDAEWQTYRQALRDITNTYTSINDVVWPTKPE